MADAIPTTMGAVVIEGPRRARVHTVPTLGFGEEEVLVRVEGCGVCGSNLPAWEGRPWFGYPLPPGNPGHEGWGVVVRAGDRVSDFKAGDRVSFLSDRAFAEYASAPQTALCRLPRKLDRAAFPGEALGCITNIFRRAQVREGQTVAIVGIGFLGAGLVALAARAGAHVVAISRRPWALELAHQLVVEIACSWRLHAEKEAVIEADAFGTRGGASVRNLNGSFSDFAAYGHEGTKTRTLSEPPDAWGGRAIVKWAERLAAGQRFDPECRSLVAVSSVLDALYARAFK